MFEIKYNITFDGLIKLVLRFALEKLEEFTENPFVILRRSLE